MQKTFNSEADLFLLYGSAASEAMFDYPCKFFQIPDCEGCIAYREENHCAIIFGDPLCPPEETLELTQAFHEFCQKSGLNVIYITVSKSFSELVLKYCPISIEICEELIFDPQNDPSQKSHRLHHRIEKAIKHGLTFHEYLPYDEGIENALLEIGQKWREGRKGISFYLGHLNFFESSMGKRWFYVRDGQKITAMAMLSRLDSKNGWLLKFFFTLPGAFSETSEFLMISLMNTLKNEGCHYLSKGMVPKDSLGEIRGLKYSASLVRYIFKAISRIFQFSTHKQYWLRYSPEKEPSYLIFTNSRIGLNEIKGLFKVLKINRSKD